MKKLKISVLVVILGTFFLVGCSKDEGEAPVISTSVYALGTDGDATGIMVPKNTDVAFKFGIKAATKLKKVELWAKEGIGINSSESKMLASWVSPATEMGDTWEVSDTIEGLDADMQYSVYVQDMDNNFSTAKVNCFLDVMRYSQSLTDGATAGTSKTFMNIESGRTFYIANTIGDPKGMDMGFTYMEGTHRACFVAFDQYYKTGSYGMVVNNLNPTMSFRNATNLMTEDDFEDEITVASQLQSYYDRAAAYSTVLNFDQDKVAVDLEEGDVVAFLTEDGRYGLMKITSVDRKDESVANNQVIQFKVVVAKKR